MSMRMSINNFHSSKKWGVSMLQDEAFVGIAFKNSDEENQVPLRALVDALTGCLNQMGVKALMGESIHDIIRTGDGPTKLGRLLKACGYPDDPAGFFNALLTQLGNADGSGPIAVNDITLPPLMLMALMEVALPGNQFIAIKSTDQLEKVANIVVPEADRDAMQEVMDTYPVRLSMHTVRQMRVSPHVAYQYLPFVEELDTVGHTNTWIGQFHQGLLEQMYQNRVIFLLNMSCPVYCRFCFRKHKESRSETNPTVDDVQTAVAHVAN
jgi:lysine 2,3-aminomutase